jgi:hypothetical protein
MGEPKDYPLRLITKPLFLDIEPELGVDGSGNFVLSHGKRPECFLSLYQEFASVFAGLYSFVISGSN